MMATYGRLARRVVPLTLLALATACNDVTSPGTVSEADRQAIQNLISQNVALRQTLNVINSGTDFRNGLMLAVSTLQRTGTVTISGPETMANGTYRAFGVQMRIISGSQNLIWTGVMAIDNLHVPTKVIIVGAANGALNTTPPTVIPEAMIGHQGTSSGGFFRTAAFVRVTSANGGTGYVVNTLNGTGTVGFGATPASGDGTSCSVQGFPGFTQCSARSARISTSFGFIVNQMDGQTTLTIPDTEIEVPATSVTLTSNPV